MKLIIELLDRWRVLPWFQGGTDAAHSFHEAIGTILGNEVHNTRKHSCAFINITCLHVAIQQGVGVGGSQAPVVNSWVRTSWVSRPHLVAVDR